MCRMYTKIPGTGNVNVKVNDVSQYLPYKMNQSYIVTVPHFVFWHGPRASRHRETSSVVFEVTADF